MKKPKKPPRQELFGKWIEKGEKAIKKWKYECSRCGKKLKKNDIDVIKGYAPATFCEKEPIMKLKCKHCNCVMWMSDAKKFENGN
jgi:hypothetical protein